MDIKEKIAAAVNGDIESQVLVFNHSNGQVEIMDWKDCEKNANGDRAKETQKRGFLLGLIEEQGFI